MTLDATRQQLAILAEQMGFAGMRISKPDLTQASNRLKDWLKEGYQGDMAYLENHQALREDPERLHPGTLRVISLYHPYLTSQPKSIPEELSDNQHGYISYYARGRDYHKTVRQKLKTLAQSLDKWVDNTQYRVFTDSAPVMEVEIAVQAGLGWRGKNTLLLSREAGSWFFLGEIFTNIPLPTDEPTTEHCGDCRQCIDICPTSAFLAPYVLDARRCISYLTIEHKGSIPEELRPLMGNRIYGCDDCQMVCPWNRFAQVTPEKHFVNRLSFSTKLADLMLWTEREFERYFEGTAIRRIGLIRFLRNVAVAIGNGQGDEESLAALRKQLSHPAELVREHVNWALKRLSE